MAATFSVLLPYYNESAFIANTLRSLLTQERIPDQIVLVDNASTDDSEKICRALIQEAGYPNALFLHEDRPGKINALETGLTRITGDVTVLCDADVHYPPHYLALAERLFRAAPDHVVALMAACVEQHPAESAETRNLLRQKVRQSRYLTSKCLTGGAGHIFRTHVLRQAGGFSARQWPYVLMDHEIVHRLHKFGRSLYHEDLWVLHTDRRKDRGDVRWGLFDRLVYRYTPGFLGDWFFYRYLGPRLEKRRMTGLNLRRQPWRKG